MKRGRKPNRDRKVEIYTVWKMLTADHSLDDIGKRFHITGERVRQVVEEMKAEEDVKRAVVA